MGTSRKRQIYLQLGEVTGSVPSLLMSETKQNLKEIWEKLKMMGFYKDFTSYEQWEQRDVPIEERKPIHFEDTLTDPDEKRKFLEAFGPYDENI